MRKLSGEQIWLLLAERGEPMTAAEIAKELHTEEQLVQDILKQEPFRFQPEVNRQWGLTAWRIHTHYPFMAKAELILRFARCPVPESIFLQLLRKVHGWVSEKGILQVLRDKDKFIFENGRWSLDIEPVIEEFVQDLIESKRQRISELLSDTKEPLGILDLKRHVELDSHLGNFAKERMLNDTERAFMQQLADSHLLHLVAGIDGIVNLPTERWIALTQHRLQRVIDYLRRPKIGSTAKNILQSVLEIKADMMDETVILSHLEQCLKDCDQLECIDGKWFYKLPFPSHYTFYDPKTFVVMVEKDERIEVGSEKERWLKEKGFYALARLGGETDVVSD